MFHYLTSSLYLFARRFLVVHGPARLSPPARGSPVRAAPAPAPDRFLPACCHLTPLNTALESHLTHLHLVAYYFELAAGSAACTAPGDTSGRRAARSAPELERNCRSDPSEGSDATTTVDGNPRKRCERLARRGR